MGTLIEINDTLQITKEQGFPSELNLDAHLKKPFTADDFAGKIFDFTNKPNIRIYKQPPVRNFLVENRNGKWIYWGLIHVLEISHNYEKSLTSGKFSILHINSPEEMKMAHRIVDRNSESDFFGS